MNGFEIDINTKIFADIFHNKENDLIIDCKVRGNPRPTIVWLKDQLPIEFDERTQQVEHGDGQCELIINKPTEKDSGIYQCTATNKLGSQKQEHKVVYTPPSTPLSRRDSGMSSAKREGSEARSAAGGGTAAESGNETADEKAAGGGGKGRRPPSGKPKEAVEEVVTSSRRYQPPSIEEMMKATRNKLFFVTHLTNRVFPENSKIKLTCVVQGPDPNIRWLKDDAPVVYSTRIKNLSRDGLCVLEISNCVPEDSGTYQLLVRNPDSEVSCSCSVQVYATSQTADFAPTFTRNLKRMFLVVF